MKNFFLVLIVLVTVSGCSTCESPPDMTPEMIQAVEQRRQACESADNMRLGVVKAIVASYRENFSGPAAAIAMLNTLQVSLQDVTGHRNPSLRGVLNLLHQYGRSASMSSDAEPVLEAISLLVGIDPSEETPEVR